MWHEYKIRTLQYILSKRQFDQPCSHYSPIGWEYRKLKIDVQSCKLDRILNEKIRGRTKVSEISKKVQERMLKWYGHVMQREERGSSVVECRTRNQVSPGSNPPFATVSKIGHFRSLHWCPCWLSCINEYLAIDSCGNVSDLVLARNCSVARKLPGEAELVLEWTGLPGMAKSVKLWILRYIKTTFTIFRSTMCEGERWEWKYKEGER